MPPGGAGGPGAAGGAADGGGGGAAPPLPAPPFILFVRLPNSKSIAVEATPSTSVGDVVGRALARSDFRLLRVCQTRAELGGRPLQPEAVLRDVGAGHLSTLRIYLCAESIDRPGRELGEELRRLAAGYDVFPAQGGGLHDALSSGLQQRQSLLEGGVLQFKLLSAMHASKLLQSLADLARHPPDTRQAAFGRLWLQRLVPAVQQQYRLALRQEEEGDRGSSLARETSLLILGMLVELLAVPDMVCCASPWEAGASWAADQLRRLADASCKSGVHGWWVAPSPSGLHEGSFSAVLRLVSEQLVNNEEPLRGKARRLTGLNAFPMMQNSCRRIVNARSCARHALARLMLHLTKAFLRSSQPSQPAHALPHIVAGLRSVCLLVHAAAVQHAGPSGASAAALQGLSRCLLPLLSSAGALLQASETCVHSWGSSSMQLLLPSLQRLLEHAAAQRLLQSDSFQRCLFRDGGLGLATHPALRKCLPLSLRLGLLRRLADEPLEASDWLLEASDWEQSDSEDEEGALMLVSRDGQQILETSFVELMAVSPRHLTRHGLAVRFAGEPGYGAGVTREWLSLLVPQLFNLELGLFRACAGDPQGLFPGTAAQEGHLQYMRMAGRVMGLALLHGVPLGFRLASAFYQGLAAAEGSREGGAVCFDDLEQLEPEVWRSCLEVLNAEDASHLFLTFTLSHDEFGMSVDVPLSATPDEPVTNANREAYVAAVARRLLWDRVADEVAAVRRGLQDVFKVHPARLLSQEEFNQQALGSPPYLSSADWRQHTCCEGWGGWKGCPQEKGPGTDEPKVLRWFWILLAQMDQGQRSALLRFWTSLPCLPFGGWAALPMRPRIVRAERATQPLPVAHTCFLELALPDYPDILSLAGGLQEALAAAEGFGMA